MSDFQNDFLFRIDPPPPPPLPLHCGEIREHHDGKSKEQLRGPNYISC